MGSVTDAEQRSITAPNAGAFVHFAADNQTRNRMKDLAARSPINRQAARMLQRAPWWAHYNEITKSAEKVIPAHEWELHADLFLPPPQGGSQPPIDRRGTRIRFNDGNVSAVITGHQRTKERCRSDGEKKGKIHYWWTVSDDGAVSTVKWGPSAQNAKKFQVLIQEE